MDTSSRLFNALREAFGPSFTNSMYWVHYFRNVDKFFSEKGFEKRFKKGHSFPQNYSSLFDNAFNLLNKKKVGQCFQFPSRKSGFAQIFRTGIENLFLQIFGIKKKYCRFTLKSDKKKRGKFFIQLQTIFCPNLNNYNFEFCCPNEFLIFVRCWKNRIVYFVRKIVLAKKL